MFRDTATVGLVFLVLLVICIPVQCDTITDDTGNEAYDNGTIHWGTVPESEEYKTNTTYDPGTLEMLYDFARSFIATIQPYPLPYALFTDLLAGNFDISTEYMKILNYAMGLGICLILGLLFLVCMPLCGCCVCCCRCCGNCGGSKTQTKKPNDDCTRMGLGLALFLMAVLMCAASVCIYITNERVTVALEYSDDSVANNLDDIGIFLNNTIDQFKYIAIDMYGIVNQAIQRDIDDLAYEVGTPLVDGLLEIIDPAIDAIIDFGSVLTDVGNSLTDTTDAIDVLLNSTQALVDALNDLKADIAATKSSCSANCVPTTACDAIDESILAVDIDFSGFPDLSSVTSNMDGILSENLTALALTGRQAVEDLPDLIDDSTVDTRETIKTTLDEYADLIEGMIDGLVTQFTGAFDIPQTKAMVQGYIALATSYDEYRWYGAIGFTALYSLIPLCFALGVCCGVAGQKKDEWPTERGTLMDCGGKCVCCGVAIAFMLSAILMLLCVVTFVVGANLDKICDTLVDLSFFSDFLDNGGIPSFSLSGILLGNSDIPLSLYNVFLGCRDNEAAFPLLKLDQLIPLDSYLNVSNQLGDIDSQFASIGDAVDVDSLQILTPEVQQLLDDFRNSGAADIDYQAFYDILSGDIISFDIDAFADALDAAAALCTGSTATEMTAHATTVRSIRDTELTNLQNDMTALNDTLADMQVATDSIVPSIDTLVSAVNTTEINLQAQATDLVMDAVMDYVDRILDYIFQFVDKVFDLIYNDLLPCRPVWNLYDSFVVIICNYIVDVLNGFWFGIGWGLIFFLPAVIVGTKLTRFYYKMNECEGYDEDEEAGIKGEGEDLYDEYGNKKKI